jgi:hypothetical protein
MRMRVGTDAYPFTRATLRPESQKSENPRQMLIFITHVAYIIATTMAEEGDQLCMEDPRPVWTVASGCACATIVTVIILINNRLRYLALV